MIAVMAALSAVSGLVVSAPPASAVDAFTIWNEPPGLEVPTSLAVDGAGTVWATQNAGPLVVFDPVTGVATPSSDPAASGARFVRAAPDGVIWFTGSSMVKRVDPETGVITSFPNAAGAVRLAFGPDGAVWYTRANGVGRLDPANGQVQTFPTDAPGDIEVAPDGGVWFLAWVRRGTSTISDSNIERLDPDTGTVWKYWEQHFDVRFAALAPAADGTVWFSFEAPDFSNRSSIGRVAPGTRAITYLPQPHFFYPRDLTIGPDGNAWSSSSGGWIDRVTPDGQITSFRDAETALQPYLAIAAGPDALWFAGYSYTGFYDPPRVDQIGSLRVVDASLTATLTADEPSVRVGEAVHYDLTVTNTGGATLTGVRISDEHGATCAPAGAVRAGQQVVVECTYTPVFEDRGTLAQRFTVDSDETQPVRTPWHYTTVTARPDLDVEQTRAPTRAEPGDDVVFHFSAVNSGDIRLHGVVAVDERVPACSFTIGVMDVGQRRDWECHYRPTIADADHVVNTATVAAEELPAVTSNEVSVRVVAPAAGYADVARNDWYRKAVDWVTASSILPRAADGRFRPNRTITRAEAVAALWRLADAPTGLPPSSFRDVPSDAPYLPALDAACAGEVLTGCDNGLFRPGGSLTRSQLVSWLWALAGRPTGAPHRLYPDVPAGAGYVAALDWARSMRLVSPYPDGTFRPAAIVKRANFAASVFTLAGTEAAWASWPGAPLSTWRFR